MCLYSHKSASLFLSALYRAPVFVLLIFVVVFAVIIVLVKLVFVARRRKLRRPERLGLRKAFHDVVSVEHVSSAFTRLRVNGIPLFLFAKQFQVVLVLQLSELYTLLLLKHHDLDLLYKLRLRLINRDEFGHI